MWKETAKRGKVNESCRSVVNLSFSFRTPSTSWYLLVGVKKTSRPLASWTKGSLDERTIRRKSLPTVETRTLLWGASRRFLGVIFPSSRNLLYLHDVSSTTFRFFLCVWEMLTSRGYTNKGFFWHLHVVSTANLWTWRRVPENNEWLEGRTLTRESNSEFTPRVLNFQHSLCLVSSVGM